MVSGDKRRKIEEGRKITAEDLALECYNMSERDSALISLLYLSGRRICEILQLRKEDIKIEGNRVSFETFNAKVFRKKKTGNYVIEVTGDFTEKIRDREGNLIKEIPYDTRYYEKIDPHFRLIKKADIELAQFLLKRLASLSEKDYLFKAERSHDKNRPISYNWAYQIIRHHFPNIWPHLLRHDRFTEVFRIYKDDLLSAHKWTFHKRFESNDPYIRPLEIEKERV